MSEPLTMADFACACVVFAVIGGWLGLLTFVAAEVQKTQRRINQRLRELESIQGALAHAVAQMQRDRDATLWVDRDGIVHRGNE